ncbi:hypothetical protein PSYCIT7_022095 [Pseudomonas syringae Cit 7]|uniref:Lipoprotein n=1 Tax=Pseudomonas syringae Cit 7 TaxID=629264 RepID=A0A8T8LVU3_PSESX|nr:hypothetical protein [Pseudomonas syringae]MCK9752695.1 hypothetical protein [Pseudomonas syringae pv. syringae]MCH5651836.1 hypothetical protein [Pseudomonas syringae]PBP77528.1 hypothetical protein CCL19_01450 [Pseudomonas syringae]PBP90805.1 hypothetical protein CCL20_03145 [Pseudomonas syringae]QUP65457.1 hypothetical protein PSYCIT7_022095 [Pseudomonas syringae Cit 7]
MKVNLLLVAVLALLIQGCGVTMTRYEPSFDNVQKLKQTPPLLPIRQTQVSAAAGQDSLQVRGNPVTSPSGSITQHIQDALTGELDRAGLIDPQSPRQLNVLVTQNELTAGMGTGTGTIAAHFTLINGAKVEYDATKQVSSQWNSSFLGAVAIPNAANAYNPLVRDLLKALYSDPLFTQALNHK